MVVVTITMTMTIGMRIVLRYSNKILNMLQITLGFFQKIICVTQTKIIKTLKNTTQVLFSKTSIYQDSVDCEALVCLECHR